MSWHRSRKTRSCLVAFSLSLLFSASTVWAQSELPSASRQPETDPFRERCIEVIDVPISLREALPNFSEYGKVRRQAIDRASEQAVEQVIGLSVASSREIKTLLHNEIVDSRYREEVTGESGGLVRPRIDREEVVKIDGRYFMELDFSITVCVPKTPAVPPKQIAGAPEAFFDPLTGEPRVWYWRATGGDFEFYDNQGFHPRTGDILKPITREVIDEWRAREEEKTLITEAEKARREQEAHASGRCDELAANPSDVQRPKTVRGAEFTLLKLNIAEAIRSCREALKRAPEDGRFAYQLGRALQADGKNLSEAMDYLSSAIKRGHVAAYDNLGWAFVRLRRPAEARSMFERGARAGDPSSMVSLASLIEKEVEPGDYEISIDRASDLYARAARLGHEDAKRRLEELPHEREMRRVETRLQLEQEAVEAERRRKQEELMLGIVGGVVGTILERARRN